MEGQATTRKAVDEASHAFGSHSTMAGACSYALSVCLVGSNKLNEASELLRGVDVDSVSQMSGDPLVGPSIKLVEAEIAARRGDYLLARQLLESAAPSFNSPNAGAGEKQAIARLTTMLNAQPVASRRADKRL